MMMSTGLVITNDRIDEYEPLEPEPAAGHMTLEGTVNSDGNPLVYSV